MFQADGTLHANYGYGAPVGRVFPVHVPNGKYLKSCAPYAALWRQYQDLLAEWKGIEPVQFSGRAAELEQEAVNVIQRMKTEAAKCKQYEASGFKGGVGGTTAVGTGSLIARGLTTLGRGGVGGAGAGGAGGAPVTMDTAMATTSTGTSTTTWLLIGGVGLAAVFLLMRRKPQAAAVAQPKAVTVRRKKKPSVFRFKGGF
jgi:LPXTG-motif cell wall-anchored protein